MAGEESSVTAVTETVTPSAKEFLTDQDKHVLEMVKLKMQLAVANAEKALAQNETTKIAYENLVLQLSVKYNLKERDAITEQGEIIRAMAE